MEAVILDQVTKAKVHFRREQWKQLIIECQQSGLPIRTWCTQHGFRKQTYYNYLKKIREEELSKLPATIPLEETKPTVFKKVEVTTPVPDTKAAVIIRLPQATLEINDGASQETIQAVLLVLQSLC